jgi:hypothetical protein
VRGSSLIRLSRHALYNRRVEALAAVRANRVLLHVYDLIHDETIVALPFGCTFPIGQCFSAVNNGLHAMGTGAYHCGVEVSFVTMMCLLIGPCSKFTSYPLLFGRSMGSSMPTARVLWKERACLLASPSTRQDTSIGRLLTLAFERSYASHGSSPNPARQDTNRPKCTWMAETS